jgi:hypothetical protein
MSKFFDTSTFIIDNRPECPVCGAQRGRFGAPVGGPMPVHQDQRRPILQGDERIPCLGSGMSSVEFGTFGAKK